jgi:hypothetical protein
VRLTTYNLVDAVGRGIATAVFLWEAARDPDRRTDNLVLSGVTGFAFVTYSLAGLGVGAAVTANGEPWKSSGTPTGHSPRRSSCSTSPDWPVSTAAAWRSSLGSAC